MAWCRGGDLRDPASRRACCGPRRATRFLAGVAARLESLDPPRHRRPGRRGPGRAHRRGGLVRRRERQPSAVRSGSVSGRLRCAGVRGPDPDCREGTYNESAAIGTANMVAAAQNTPGKVILDGFSQSASPVMSAAYLLHTLHVKDDSDVQVVVAADPRFPHTGAEVQMPSFITGLYTNGERDPYDTGDIGVTSICIIGDTTCGMANPLARPISFLVYFLPGFYIHANMYDDAGKFAVVSEQTVGNTKYVILDGGNPYGMMLRDLGIPVPKEFDEVMNTLVPRQMPGQASTLFGHDVPTPREVQVALYHALGLKVPVTDPDVVNKPGNVSAGGANVATVPVPSEAPQVTSAPLSAPPVLAPAPAPPALAPEAVSVPDRPSVGRTEWSTPTPAPPAITSPVSPVPGSVTPSAPAPASPPAPLLPNPPSQGEMSFPQVVPRPG
nr:PE-PPE domain-containing protein [Gordonia sp. X0973]